MTLENPVAMEKIGRRRRDKTAWKARRDPESDTEESEREEEGGAAREKESEKRSAGGGMGEKRWISPFSEGHAVSREDGRVAVNQDCQARSTVSYVT